MSRVKSRTIFEVLNNNKVSHCSAESAMKIKFESANLER